MPIINDIMQQMTAWLAGQQLDPMPREITTSTLLPASAYPQLAVLAREEHFAPGDVDATAELAIRVSCAAGRPADAIEQVRKLAHQVRASFNASHGLGGAVKLLKANAISYGSADRRVQSGVIATAEIELEAKYCVHPMSTDH